MEAIDRRLALHLSLLLACTFPALLLLAGATDLVDRRIPNRLCAALVAGFLLGALVFRLPPTEALLHAATAVLVLAAGFLLFMAGWLGGGDAKLAAAASLWLGPDGISTFLTLMAVFGAALAVATLILRTRLGGWIQRPRWLVRSRDPAEGLPYGVAIALAGCLAFPLSDTWRLAAG